MYLGDVMKQKIAITGGIGSGKSAVLKIVRDLGFEGFSCDEIYKDILNTADYIERVAKIFPFAVKNEGKGRYIDKKALSKCVFCDEKALAKLNEIAHPLIMSALEDKLENASGKFVFAEVPLLFEGGYENRFDRVIVILRNKADRARAVAQRDGVSLVEANNRMEKQFDYDKNAAVLAKRYFVFQNDGGLNELKGWVEKWTSAVCK